MEKTVFLPVRGTVGPPICTEDKARPRCGSSALRINPYSRLSRSVMEKRGYGNAGNGWWVHGAKAPPKCGHIGPPGNPIGLGVSGTGDGGQNDLLRCMAAKAGDNGVVICEDDPAFNGSTGKALIQDGGKRAWSIRLDEITKIVCERNAVGRSPERGIKVMPIRQVYCVISKKLPKQSDIW